MKNIEFNIPEGYVPDKVNSTDKKIVFKYAKPDNIIERIKTFEDALDELPSDDDDVMEYHNLINGSVNARFIAFAKLIIIIKVLNEGWKPNMSNQNEYKYWNYFYMNNGTFSYSSPGYLHSCVHVPSALFLKTSELAKHAAKIAFEEYKTYMTK
jgi:hypothetical protein